MSVNLKYQDIAHLTDLPAHRIIEIMSPCRPMAALYQTSVEAEEFTF